MVFLTKENKLLMSRRLNTWFGNNQFSVPGGMVDTGETPEIAAVRELQEETNITVDPKNLKLFHQDETSANGRMFENFYFVTTLRTGEPVNKEPHRHSELDWYPLDELPDDTMPLIIKLLSKI